MILTKQQIDKIKELKNNGLSISQISKEMNLSYFTIKYHYNDKYKEDIKKAMKKIYKRKVK